MRVTVSHNQPKEEVIRAIDGSFDDLFRGIGIVPLRITNEKRSWSGTTLTFSFDARMGLIAAPIAGMVEVTERDVTITVDFGWLERLIPAKQAGPALQSRIRGLLK
jgi:hypothetical protein